VNGIRTFLQGGAKEFSNEMRKALSGRSSTLENVNSALADYDMAEKFVNASNKMEKLGAEKKLNWYNQGPLSLPTKKELESRKKELEK
jgi:hypothetical protein